MDRAGLITLEQVRAAGLSFDEPEPRACPHCGAASGFRVGGAEACGMSRHGRLSRAACGRCAHGTAGGEAFVARNGYGAARHVR